MLRASENSNLRSEGFATKQPIFAGSPYILTQQIAQAANWTKNEIAERQKVLAEFAVLAWAL